MRSKPDINPDFRCVHCGQFVSSAFFLAGVHNRNHCPYCLYSRHMDLFKAGDRLSACKGPMRPVGLTFKRTRKKYKRSGELMLIHQCLECGNLAINRIAADDDAQAILAIFARPHLLEQSVLARLEQAFINPLSWAEAQLVKAQLFGQAG